MKDHAIALPAGYEMEIVDLDVEALRARAEHAERTLRAVTAQRDVLSAVIRQLLDGATPEMVAAVEDRVARATGLTDSAVSRSGP